MNNNPDSTHPGGSGKDVDDFGPYCEGDIEPTLNKKINTLIDADTNYIVYLDDQLFVEYSWTSEYGESPEGFSDIANTVAHLEGLSPIYLTTDQQLAFRRMLGEAMARVVGDKDTARAKEALDTAISFLNARSLERARLWYLQASSTATGICLVVAGLLWIFRTPITTFLGTNTFEVSLGGLIGSLGSFLSIWIRPSRIRMDAGALKHIHAWEGAARIVVGAACALATALAVKADIILSITKSSEHPLAYLLIICIAAGFSERVFLNLIGHFNDPDLEKKRKPTK